MKGFAAFLREFMAAAWVVFFVLGQSTIIFLWWDKELSGLYAIYLSIGFGIAIWLLAFLLIYFLEAYAKKDDE
jgi:hypothetical protein